MLKLLRRFVGISIISALFLFTSCNSNQSETYHYDEDDFNESYEDEEFDLDTDEKKSRYNTFSKEIELKKTKYLHAEIEFGAGEFYISSTSKNMANVHFYYEKEHWSPYIDFYYDIDTSSLDIRLKKDHDFSGNHKNKCKVLLNDDVEMDLTVAFGAGEGKLDLSEINLHKANFALGAGDFEIDFSNSSPVNIDVAAGVGSGIFDLSGKWKNNCIADFACGIGDLTIKIPRSTGVKVEVSGLLGDVDAFGLKKIGRRTYVNNSYKDSEFTIDIDIAGALGNIDLILEDQ